MTAPAAVVTSTPGVMLGKPVVAGTRVTVESVLHRIAAGETVEQIASSHPRLSVQRVRDVIAWAAGTLAAERVIDPAWACGAAMNPRVTRIESAKDGKLLLRFTNGELRTFDVAPYIERGGVFVPLAEPEVFAAARVVAGAVEWPGEVDLSNDTLYLRSVPVAGGGRGREPA